MTGPAFDVADWLADAGADLAVYAPAFRANDVSPSVLPHLTADDLREMGVLSIGHRRLILAAAARPVPAVGTPVATDERRVLTVLFCDLVDSTALATTTDPEDFVAFIARFRQVLDSAVTPLGGTVVQYLGDGIMACFGYPAASEHDAERAVAAGLAAVGAVAGLTAPGGGGVSVRVGIATGLAVIGATSHGALQDLSAVGDTPNLAARLQTLAPPGGVVIADQTRAQIGTLFDCDDIGTHQMKGFDAPRQVWRVRGAAAPASRFAALRGRGGHAPFVGRAAERRALAAHLAARPAGALLVMGEAGFGKSRLVHEALTDAGRSHPLILQCSPVNTGVALHPLRYLLVQLTGLTDPSLAGTAFARLSALMESVGPATAPDRAVVADFLDLSPSDASDELLRGLSLDDRRQRLVAMLAALVVALARQGGALLVEDAGWLDPSTAALLDRVAPLLAAQGVPVIATARPGPLPGWAQGLPCLAVDRLAAPDIAALVAGIAAAHQLPDDVAATIASRSDGVPIFAEELTRGWLAGGGERLAQVPLSLTESLLGRMDRLLHGRRIAALAAAIGREFPLAVLAAVTDLPDPALTAGVAELMAAGILEPGQSQFGPAIRFRHNLVREAAYDMHLRRDRAALHGRIADVLEDRFPAIAAALPHVLAGQRAAAGQPAAASTAWQSAARLAAGRSAYAEAVAFFEQALAACGDTLTDRREMDLRVALLGAVICAQGYQDDRALTETARVMVLADRLGDAAGLMPAMQSHWVQLGSSNNDQAALEFAVRARVLARQGTVIDRLIAERICATSHLFRGRFAESVVHYTAFLSMYDPDAHGPALRTGHSDHATMVMMGLAEAHLVMGNADIAADWRSRTIATAAASGRNHDRCHTLAFAGLCHTLLIRQDDEAQVNLAALQGILSDHAVANWGGYVDLFAGLLQARAGDKRGLAIARRGGASLATSRAFGSWWMIALAGALVDGGDADAARPFLAQGRAIAALGDRRLLAELYRQEARTAPDPAAARALLHQGLAVAQDQSAGFLAGLLQADLAALAVA